jgi:capsular polysaccharide transport system permease protein
MNKGAKPMPNDNQIPVIARQITALAKTPDPARQMVQPLQPAPAERPTGLSARSGMISFALVVMLPCLIAFWFMTAFASARYTAELRVAVRSSDAAVMTGMGDMLGLPSQSAASQDAQALVQYLQSRAVISDLQQQLDIRQIYAQPDIDAWSRLSSTAPAEDVLQTWRNFVRPTYESSNNTVVIRVTTFAPDTSVLLSQALIAQSDAFVNRLSESARSDAVTFARRELALAEERLSAARLALADLQDQEATLDPTQDAAATEALLSRLNDQMTSQRAVLATQRTQLGADAPSVQVTEQIIAGLASEIDRIRGNTITTGADNDGADRPLSLVLRDFQLVSNELDYAQRAYESAVTTFEAARIDADRRQTYLATVVAPALPEKPSFPNPVSGLLLTFALALGVWLIGWVSAFAIKDHM